MDSRTIQRVKQEVDLLAREIGGSGSDRIQMGLLTISSREYLGVIVKRVAVSPQRFPGNKSLKLLVLLPQGYPMTPPVGVYVDLPYKVSGESHLTGKGYHGAPTLTDKGWYWYCHAMGGFEARRSTQLWQPAAKPDQGHNLATVVAAARVALHGQESVMK